MAAENASGVTSSKLPQAQALVPGGRQSVSTVGGDHLYNKKRPVSQSILQKRRNTSFFFFQVGFERRTQSETMWEWPSRLRLG